MNFLLQCSKSLKQESNPSMRTKNSVRVILQEPALHPSFPISFLSTALCVLAQLFSDVHSFRISYTFKKPPFQKEDGKDTNSKE
jgi:hypothetical protein